MPLSPLQSRILGVIAQHRNPESFVAGGTVIQRAGFRHSKDIDIFNDRKERLAEAAYLDFDALKAKGFDVAWERETDTMYRARVGDGASETRIDWVVDSEFRFFPAMPDGEFGYALHPLDLAANKLLAAVGRVEVRDALDLLWIDEHVQPVGAVAWAAVEKDPGWMPDGLLSDLRWRARYQDRLLAEEQISIPMTAGDLNNAMRALVARAERLVAAMPRHLEYGALLNRDGSLAKPAPDDPASFEGIVVHHGSRKGCWPGTMEIASAMLRDGSYPSP